MPLYSKHDRIFRKLVPSVAKLSYNPVMKIAGNAIAGMLARPFPDLRNLPPNHLCIRIGAGNQLFNSHINFIQAGNELWLTFLARKYCTSNSDVVELGCGCGQTTTRKAAQKIVWSCFAVRSCGYLPLKSGEKQGNCLTGR